MNRLFTLLVCFMLTFATASQAIGLPLQDTTHRTKSGKLDRRYNANKHLKKDGTMDMRYKSSKSASKAKSTVQTKKTTPPKSN